MPKILREDDRLKKSVKLDSTSRQNTYYFSDGADVQRHLQNQDSLTDVLTALRNQLTIKFGEGPVQPQDERLALARSWLESSPGAQTVFNIWENTTERQPYLLALLISVLSSLLTVLSTQYTHHKFGQPILKTLLSPDYLVYINSYLTASHNELIIATLKLFRAMSTFGGGCEKRTVLEGFSWENKKLHRLLYMRRRAKMTGSTDVLAVPDIRTLYVLFILSFVDDSAASSVKSSFLEQRHDIFRSIFGGIDQDPYPLARKILEVAWTGIWLDSKIKRTVKVHVFNETCLHLIMKLYSRLDGEGSDDQIPADLAHHFLLAICTHPGVGVCFKDRGWYPRETRDDVPAQSGNDEATPKNARIYNKILSQILKSLKVNEDPRQQELALRIMSACTELVCGYWSAASLTLEPRLSSKWIANIAFFGNVISLPIPEASFLLPGSSLYLPSPPPLSAFLENVFPSVNTKAHFSRGIMSASPLVRHCTAIALAKCLLKYSEILRVMHKIEAELEEGESNGQWRKRRNELELEARRRVPDFQVVIAFSQKASEEVQTARDHTDATTTPPGKVRMAMMAESSTRLLWLYHLCFPSLIAEVRYDVGKLLQNSFDDKVGTDNIIGPTSGLDTLRRLHVLRLVRESNQFLGFGKSGPRSSISILLTAYASVDITAIRDAIRSLVQHIFSGSILFEHDPEEVRFWLSSLPMGARLLDAESPEGAPLLNEQAAVVSFLDDCVQLCVKAPYGYVEELSPSTSFETTTANGYQLGGNTPSPLLATVMEQISPRIAASLSPSDTLAIVSFARRLIVRLACKTEGLGLLLRLSEKFVSPVREIVEENHVIAAKAVAQEITTLKNYLSLLGNPAAPVSVPESPPSSVVDDILDRFENTALPTSSGQCRSLAFQLIDCVRLNGSPLDKVMVTRLINFVSRIHLPAVRTLLTYVDPSQRLLRDPQFFTLLRQTQSKAPFDWAFIQCGPEQLSEVEYRQFLTGTVFDDPQPFFEAKSTLNVIAYRLLFEQSCPSTGDGTLLLIADIMQAGRSVLHTEDFTRLKEHLFGMPQINALFTSSTINSEMVEQGTHRILDAAVDPTKVADRNFLLPYSSHWAQLASSAPRFSFTMLAQTTLWLPYMAHEEVLSILDQVLQDFGAIEKEEDIRKVLQAVFLAVEQHANNTPGGVPGLRSRLPQLVSLYCVQPNWDLLESLIARAIDSAFIAWIDGVPADASNSSGNLGSLVVTSCSRWSNRAEFRSEGLGVSVFLNRPKWTSHTVSIIKSLIYASETARQVTRTFLESPASLKQPALHLAPVIWSWFDASDISDVGSSGTWRKHFEQLTASIVDNQAPRHHRLTCRRAIHTMIQKLPSLRSELFSDLLARVLDMTTDSLTSEILRLGKSLIEILPQESDTFVHSLLEHALSWASLSFGGPDSLDDGIVTALTTFAKCFPSIEPRLTDPVLTALIQNRLSDARAVECGVILVDSTNIKPLLVNRHLQSVVQHADFYTHTGTNAATRDSIIHLVHALFLKHPTNTCQPSHVLPLSPIYGGTLSVADRRLLNIFSLFEETRKTSAASLLVRSVSGLDNPLDILLNLDPASVFRASMFFPSWRKLDDLGHHLDIAHPLDARICDPVFVVLLIAHVLATRRPSSTMQWVQLFRTNVISLLIRSLSSRNGLLRDTCIAQISVIMDTLQDVDMQEKPHVLYILHLLKDAFKDPLKEPSQRLPSFPTLLLAHALRGVFYPEHFIYPLTAQFLLQRTELDTTDVPMLYSMLYSSSDNWRKERSWILKFLADAMLGAGDDEWKVFKRRHTWDLLASLFQSRRQDRTLRNEILEVLLNLTSSRRITTSLILKSGLLSWIEMMLLTPREDESLLWMRVLENILDVVDPIKLESATGSEWRAAIGRCMALLHGDTASTSLITTLWLKSRIVMKLGLLSGPNIPTLRILLSHCLVGLRNMEKELIIPTIPVVLRSPSQSRHTSYSLREVSTADSHELWGEVIVNLWRASMTSRNAGKAWDELTPRVLVWNMLVGCEDHATEWARREVVWNTTQTM